jgi:hypothetical protein
MSLSRSRAAVRTILGLVGDVVRFVSRRCRRMPNSPLRICSCGSNSRCQVKPRRADDATRITLVALSYLIEWRRVPTVMRPDTLIRCRDMTVTDDDLRSICDQLDAGYGVTAGSHPS